MDIEMPFADSPNSKWPKTRRAIQGRFNSLVSSWSRVELLLANVSRLPIDAFSMHDKGAEFFVRANCRGQSFSDKVV
jgi:hypothetical protein